MNTRKNQSRVLGIVIILTIMFSLLFPASTVFADDSPPLAETTETVNVPGEEEVPPEEEVAPEDEQPAVEDPVIEASAVAVAETDEPVTVEAATDEPVTVEAATEEPAAEDTAAEEEIPVLAQLPEGTEMVVLDDSGGVVPLASQEAAVTIANSDPIWCPDNVAPIANTGGCSNSYSSMTALLAALTGTNQPTQNGTIWLEKTYNSSTAEPGGTTNIAIDGDPDYMTWRNYSLTIQGGWDGPGTNTIDASTPSLFSGDRLRIVDWRNNVTIRNILFEGAIGGPSLEIELDLPGTGSDSNPAYEVLIEEVEARNNLNNRGVHITNDESPGSITIKNSTFKNNGNISNNNDDGLYILARGNVTLMNVIATGNRNEGVEIHNIFSTSGASVQINGTNDFSGNQGNGLLVRSDGNVTLTDVTADNNRGNGADIDNSSGNGDVTITGYSNSFSNNGLQGLKVITNGDIELNFATINGNNTASNSLDGSIFNSLGSADIYCSIFGNNHGIGLNALNVNGLLTFHGMDGFTDYSFNGTASFEDPDYLCAKPVLGCTDPNALNYDPLANTDDGSCNFPVNNGGGGGSGTESNSSIMSPTSVQLNCSNALTELQLEDGDFVTLANLCEYDAALEEVLETELLGLLSNNVQFVSGLNVVLLQDGNPVTSLPEGTNITVAFKIPSGMEGENFAILRWDGSKWVEEIVIVENGYVKATSTNTGIFVLVVK